MTTWRHDPCEERAKQVQQKIAHWRRYYAAMRAIRRAARLAKQAALGAEIELTQLPKWEGVEE
jgi:hypothetical protein